MSCFKKLPNPYHRDDKTSRYILRNLAEYTIFYRKLKISADAENFLQLSDFEYSEFLMNFSELLKNLLVPTCSFREHFKKSFFDPFPMFTRYSSNCRIEDDPRNR